MISAYLSSSGEKSHICAVELASLPLGREVMRLELERKRSIILPGLRGGVTAGHIGSQGKSPLSVRRRKGMKVKSRPRDRSFHVEGKAGQIKQFRTC